jgi:hypothetical protein
MRIIIWISVYTCTVYYDSLLLTWLQVLFIDDAPSSHTMTQTPPQLKDYVKNNNVMACHIFILAAIMPMIAWSGVYGYSDAGKILYQSKISGARKRNAHSILTKMPFVIYLKICCYKYRPLLYCSVRVRQAAYRYVLISAIRRIWRRPDTQTTTPTRTLLYGTFLTVLFRTQSFMFFAWWPPMLFLVRNFHFVCV